MARTFARWGAMFGFFAVALGAFGAHGLRDRLSSESMAVFQTGVQYQMIHALALLGLAALFDKAKFAGAVGWLFVFGVLIFSGSLYLLAITGERWIGAVTPFGGLCFLAGWALLTIAIAKNPKASDA